MENSTHSNTDWSTEAVLSHTTIDKEFLPFTDSTVTVFAVIIIIFAIFGFFANLLTIVVIVTSKRLNNVFNRFLLSLCCSDLYSAFISWINLYRRTWGFNVFGLPNFFCWFYWASDMWTSYATALHIVSYAILRLLSIWKPTVFRRIELIHGRIWIVSIWVLAFFCGFIPFAIFSGAKTRDRSDRRSPTARWPSCTQNQETLDQFKQYIKIAYPIFFYIPLVTMTLVSFFIGFIIAKRRMKMQSCRSKEGSKTAKSKEKQAILQLVLIIGSFIIGYIPFTVFEYWTANNTDASYEGWKKEWMFGTVQYLLLRFSECLNPMFYNLSSTKMRQETRNLIRRLFCRPRQNNDTVVVPMSSTGLEL